MAKRQTEGSQTWRQLKDWDRNQKASERLAAHILRIEGYKSADPSHPLGGQDGLKDIICYKNNKKWIGAVYFPREQKRIGEIRKKFTDDLTGVDKNNSQGFAFITNQELTVGERNSLIAIAEDEDIEVDLFHLERITMILNSPECYGIRLEFLDIEMDKEEQLSFIATRDKEISELNRKFDTVISYINQSEILRNEFNKIQVIDSQLQNYERISEKFRFDEGTGWYVHKDTGDVFCYECMQNGIIRQLIKDSEHAAHWKCPCCNKYYFSIMRTIMYFLGLIAPLSVQKQLTYEKSKEDK